MGSWLTNGEFDLDLPAREDGRLERRCQLGGAPLAALLVLDRELKLPLDAAQPHLVVTDLHLVVEARVVVSIAAPVPLQHLRGCDIGPVTKRSPSRGDHLGDSTDRPPGKHATNKSCA